MKLKNLLSALLLLVSTSLFAQNANYLTVAELMQEYNNLNLASGTTASGTYTVRGYVTFWKNGYPQYQNASFYIDDTETGSTTLLQCFRLTGATTADQRTLVVGDYVEVQNAQLTNYYGSAELKNGSFTIISDATPAQYMGTTTIANFLSQADLKNSYQLTGVVSGLSAGNNMTYGNLNLTDETGIIYVYGVMDANGQSGNFASLNIENGDTLTIRGTYTTYQGNPQIANAQYISHSKYVEIPPQFMGATTIANFLEKKDTKNIYQLSGEITYIDDENNALTIYDETAMLQINGIVNEDGSSTTFEALGITTYDTLTVKAVYRYDYGVDNAVFVRRVKPNDVLSGQCGDNAYFSIDVVTKTLSISGTGDIWQNNWDRVIYYMDGERHYDNWDDYYGDSIVAVVISEGITSIPRACFYEADNLQSVSLPSTMQSIGENAFVRCNISSIYIPENVSVIGNYAFSGCPLTEINVSNQNLTYSSQDGVLFDKAQKILYIYPRNKVGNIYVIPNSVEKIYHSAFDGNKNIISVSMGNNVRQIGIEAFADCEKLISLTLSDSLTAMGYRSVFHTALYYDDREWDNGALYLNNCLILGERIELDPVDPNAIETENSQDEHATLRVDSIYTIKDGTHLVATYALKSVSVSWDNWLKKLTIPNSIEYINPDAFVQSTLEEVVWNAKHCHDFVIETIIYDFNELRSKDSIINYNPFVSFEQPGWNLLESSVKKISFAKDVEYLPAGLCSVMPNLEEVRNYNPEPIAVSINMFENVPSTCILFVPKGSKEKYEAAPVWRDFYRIREMEDTAIEDIINSSSTPQKVIDNGQLLIFHNGKTFTVQGLEVR